MPDAPVEPAGGGRYPADMETRVAILEHLARTTAAALERIERRFETVDRRFEAVDRRFESVDRRLDVIIAAQRADFRWLVGVILATWASTLGLLGGILGVMAHGFHWI